MTGRRTKPSTAAPRDDMPPPTCDTGNPLCGATPARLYPAGYRCDRHRPRPYRTA